MGSSERLRKNVAKRQAEFTRLKNPGGQTIDDLVDLCAELTNQCAPQLDRLSASANACFEVRRRQRDEIMRATQREIDSFAEASDRPSDDPRDRAMAMIAAATLEARLDQIRWLDARDDADLVALEHLANLLTSGILEAEASTFALDAFGKSVEVTIGFIPIAGNVYAAMKAGYDLSKRNRQRASSTAKEINALDDYRDALLWWLGTADAMILEFERCAKEPD